MVISDLYEGEKSFRRLAENLPGIVYRILIEDDNRVIFFNDMVQTMTGYSPEDLKKGKVCSIDPLILPEDRLNVINIVKDAIENNVPFEAEYRINNKSGELKWFFERGRPIRGDNGNPSYIDGVIFDITNRKKAEQKLRESEKKFKTFFDESPIGIELYDSSGKLVDLNESCLEIFGVSSIDEVRGFELFKNPNIPKEQLKKLKKGHIIRQETIFDFDLVKDLNLYETKKSGKIWIDSLISPLYLEENNKISHYIIQLQEITESKIAEQKIKVLNENLDKAVNERTNQLKKSEEQYNILSTELETIIDHYPGLTFYKDTNNNFIRINQNVVDYYNSDTAGVKANLTKKDIEGKNLSTLFPKDIAQAYWDDDLEVINSGTPKLNIEESFKTEHGIRWLNSQKIPYFDENGEIRGIIGFSIDITESKKAEQNLKESEEKFRLLFDSIADPIHVIDADLKIIYINPAFERWLKSFNLDLNIVGKTPVEAWPFIGERVYDEYQKVFKTKQIHIKEDWAHVNDVDTFTETRKIPILKSGNVVQVITIIRDFSDRKKAEQKLKESENKFKLYYENAPMGYQSLDSNGNILDVNKAWINFFGYSKEEVIGKWFGDFINSEYLDVFNTKFLELKKTGEICGADFEIIKKDGSHAIVLFNGNINFDKNENFKQIHCIFQDITEQQQIQIELRESENLLKNAQELAHIGHWKLNPSTMEVSGSDEFFKIFGLTHDKATLEKFAEVIHPEDREMYLFHIRRGMEKGESWDIEHRVISKDGTEKWVHALGEAIKDDDGKIIMLIGTVQDITERKEMEQKYLKQNVFLNNILESLTHPFYVINVKDYKVALANSTASSEGLEKGQYCYTLTHHNNNPCEAPCVCPLNEVKNTKKACVVEHMHYDKEGNEKIYEIYGYPILDENGNVVQMIEYALNITDRKIAQRELKKSEEKYRHIVESIPIGMHMYQLDANNNLVFTGANPSADNLLGVDNNQFIGKTIEEAFPPLTNTEIPEKYRQAAKEGKTWSTLSITYEDELIQGAYEVTAFQISPKKMVASFIDITDRKKTEQRLKKSEEKYRHLFENSPISLWEEDFSEVKNYIEILKNSGIKDFRAYFDKNPEEVKKCVSMIKLVDINKKTLELYKANKKEDFFADLEKIFTEVSLDAFKEQIITFARGKTWFESEAINWTLNGEKIHIFIVSEIVTGFKEDWSKILVSITDISDRKKAEQELKESEEKFRTITEQSFMGVIIIQDGLFKYFNQQAAGINGYSLEEIQNWKPYEFAKVIHPEDSDFVMEQARKKQEGKIDVVRRHKYRIIKKSGEIAWVDNFSKTINYMGRSADLVMTEDITDKIIAEQQLKESEEKFRKQNVFLNNILESLTHPFYVINADDYTIALTNSAASSEGLENGKYCYSLTHKRDTPCIAPCKCPLDEVKITKRSCVVEHTHYDREGNEKKYEIYGYPILDESGNVVQMIEYALNITDRKIAQQELKESEEKYRNLFEKSPNAIVLLDFTGKIIDCNIATEKTFGYSTEDLIGQNYLELPFYSKSMINKLSKEFQAITKEFEIEPQELEIKKKDGNIVRIKTEIAYFKIGEQNFFQAIIQNLTKQKQAEQKLRESEQKYRNLVETSSMGLLEIDFSTKELVYVNPKLLDIIGYTYEELLKERSFSKFIHPEDLKEMDFSRTEQKLEFRVITKDGKIKWLSGDRFHFYDENGILTYIRLWLQDITIKKELEQIKTNLLIRFSHEFKTPLISIKGYSDLILEDHRDNVNKEIVSFLEKIQEGAIRLNSLTNRFIESTQLNENLVKVNIKLVNITKLIKRVLVELEGVTKSRNHKIDLRLEKVLLITCDQEKIHMAISNLMLNASKFTPKGGLITVSTTIENGFVIISIKDNGIGFNKEELERLFKPFGKVERFGQGLDIVPDGMGMGLYITKELVELHKGMIWAESAGRNKGSTFIIRLPINSN